MFRDNALKAKIARGEPTLGVWLQMSEPSIAEIASLVGYDCLILDNEHGFASLDTTVHMMRAAQAGNATCMVRCPGSDGDYMKRVLDAGAEALMIPMVESAEEARAIVDACRYPPQGRRGYSAPTVRASGYGAAPDYAKRANENLLICLQLESHTAVAEAEAIAAVDGVDLVFIGVADLSGSLGLLEQPGEAKVTAQINAAEAAIRKAGKPMGTIPRPGHSLTDLVAEGYSFVAGLADAYLIRAGMQADVEAFRAGVGSGSK
ncbi:HpcH/HpaI aldolase family protein [Thalassobaculum litoreum]|uniref:4-hydroxy-2-oxoheptanedioate aldolase n=1 Tax=Thalassobaculum litoreum DSM 18839 TaxID=1123362 RepID=A0A8G2F324_9PROT|nr:aldolase/citrate lyase family protein [Thalassobaculum litoreum]SDF75597.1 4-hydroxy-2-oxoheptanedioate aldolase [Thalassobaculum litoreum DSM 18839]